MIHKIEHHGRHRTEGVLTSNTVVLDVSGLRWTSEQNAVETKQGSRPGVLGIEVNPVAQAATVTFDPVRISMAELRTGCGNAVSTARGSRFPPTCATSWPSRLESTAITPGPRGSAPRPR